MIKAKKTMMKSVENWKSEVRPARRGEWRFEEGSVKVDAQRRDQRIERFHDLLEDAV